MDLRIRIWILRVTQMLPDCATMTVDINNRGADLSDFRLAHIAEKR